MLDDMRKCNVTCKVCYNLTHLVDRPHMQTCPRWIEGGPGGGVAFTYIYTYNTPVYTYVYVYTMLISVLLST